VTPSPKLTLRPPLLFAIILRLHGAVAFEFFVHEAVVAPQARIIDPHTLETIASYGLPTAPDPPGTKTYQNFTGGGYFFLDNRDRIWVRKSS